MTFHATLRRTVFADQLHTAAAQAAIAEAAQILRAGGTVAFPTETVYGLGANALDPTAVAKIFTAKQRPSWDPLIVHVSDANMLAQVVAPVLAPVLAEVRVDASAGSQRQIDVRQVDVQEIDARIERLMRAFWPGPLTLLLPRNAALPLEVTAGRNLVGVRMPAHPVAHALIAACGLPIAAPSANRFGHISPTTAAHVLDDLDGRIDMVLDGGSTAHGVESTVLEVRDEVHERGGGGRKNKAILYRAGAISIEALQAVIGLIEIYPSQAATTALEEMTAPEALPSPGVGIRHYAPRARLVLLDTVTLTNGACKQAWLQFVHHQAAQVLAASASCGVLLPTGWPLPKEFSGPCFDWGSWSNLPELAQRLYAGLRRLDDLGADKILCPLPATHGVGAAIRDRLLKAAREK